MHRLGYPQKDKLTIRRAVGWGDENLLRPFIKTKDFKKALLIYRAHHRTALIEGSRLFPGVKQLLSYLKGKSYILAVASNRPTKFSWILIRHLGLAKYFDYVLCADKLKHIKPHPEILNKIMQKFSVTPAKTIYVGDMAIDAQAGRRAGVKTIMVSTGSSAIRELKKAKPHGVIRMVRQLRDLL